MWCKIFLCLISVKYPFKTPKLTSATEKNAFKMSMPWLAFAQGITCHRCTFYFQLQISAFFLPARHTELPLLSGAEDLAGTVRKEPPGNPISVSRLMLLMYMGRLLIPTPAAPLETQRIVNMVRESSWTLVCMNAKYLEHWYGSEDSPPFVSIHVPLHNILMIKNQI